MPRWMLMVALLGSLVLPTRAPVAAQGGCELAPFPDLVPRSADQARTDGFGASNFTELMVDKGFAVAWFTRDGNRLGGISEVTVQADGTTYRTTFQDYAAHVLLQTEVAQDYVEQ